MRRAWISGIILSLGLIPTLALASLNIQKPAQCPSAAAIRAIGIKDILEEHNGVWYMLHLSEQYDTKENWTFLLRGITANSEREVRKKITKILKTLRLLKGPIKGPVNNWFCQYHSSEGYTAVTMNPPASIR